MNDMGVNHVNLSNGKSLIDLRNDTLIDPFSLYNGVTAHGADGEPITGAYAAIGGENQYNCNSTGCSTSKLVVPCNFKPKYLCVVLNSPTHTTNTVIALWAASSAIIYHSRTSSGVIRTAPSSSSTSDYWSYDSTNKQLTINRPNSTYSWSAQNYRVFAFR